MLTLTTTAAEMYVHVDAPAETWLLYDARFVPETSYHLATGEYLRDLRCPVRVFPWDSPCATTNRGDFGLLAFILPDAGNGCGEQAHCLVDLAVGKACLDELVAAARAGHIPSQIELTLLPHEDLPGERAIWRIGQRGIPTQLQIQSISFRVPLVSR